MFKIILFCGRYICSSLSEFDSEEHYVETATSREAAIARCKELNAGRK